MMKYLTSLALLAGSFAVSAATAEGLTPFTGRALLNLRSDVKL